jgi:hypothetical protein
MNDEQNNTSPLIPGWWRWVALLGGILLVILVGAVTDWPPDIIAVDVEQGRLNASLPAPRPDTPLRQTFTANHDGLTELSLVLVQYAPGTETAGKFTVTLSDPAGQELLRRTFDTRTLEHNQTLTIRFDPLPETAGQSFVLALAGDEANTVSAWAYNQDVFAGGELSGEEISGPHDLHFTTRYRLSSGVAIGTAGRMLVENLGLLLLSLALTALPGALLFTLWPKIPVRLDPAAWWGLAVALGAALWPLVWFWLTIIGLGWSGGALWLVLIAGWVLVIGLQVARLRKRKTVGWRSAFRWRPAHGVLLLLLLLGLAVRLLAVRDLAFPPWVDSSRHALITAIMRDTGQVIESYAPYLPVDQFPYHFGFHTLPAGLALMGPWPLPELLLILGQWLNALVPLTMYAAGWLLTRRRLVGMLAAFLVALPFFFPAYYATWGRFTQLTAVLLLPVLLALTWLLVRGGRGWRRAWWLVGLLAAGLLLIHIRVFLIYIPLAALVWLAGLGRHGRYLLAATALAVGLTLPRLIDFAGYTGTTGTLGPAAAGYNEFPLGYVTTGWEPYFLVAAALLLLLAALAWWRRKAWATLPLVLAAWVGLVIGVLSDQLPLLPATWLINVNSVYITLFIPIGLLIAVVSGRVWRWLEQLPVVVRPGQYALAGVLLAALTLFGLQQQSTILNPVTILALPPDTAGLLWADENLPAEAKVMVNSWRWLGQTWAVSDGGAWLVPMTGRSSTTPPIDYVFNRELDLQIRAFNEAATAIEDWSTPQATVFLRENGVTHLFVGRKGGFLDPAQLLANPDLDSIYQHDGVFIFARRKP